MGVRSCGADAADHPRSARPQPSVESVRIDPELGRQHREPYAQLRLEEARQLRDLLDDVIATTEADAETLQVLDLL